MRTDEMMLPLRATAIGLCTVIAACNGNDDEFADPGADAYQLESQPFTLAGGEAALNLGDPDAVLAAALASVSTGLAIAVGDVGTLDDGAPAPGRGSFFCDAGIISEGVVTSGGVRTVTLTSDQCYDNDDGSVQDGIYELAYSQPSASEAQGTLSFGFGAAPFLFASDDRGFVSFGQLRGSESFDGDFDGSPGNATVAGLQYLIGSGARPRAGNSLSLDRRIEILAGSGSVNFAVDSSVTGATQSLEISGPISIAGSGAGLDAACRFTARYSVATNVPIAIDDSDDDASELARDGLLTLSTAAGSATVQFDSAGNAQVTRPVGPPMSYTAAQVRDFCGL